MENTSEDEEMGPDLQPAQAPNSMQNKEPNPTASSSRFSLPVGIKVNTWTIGESHTGPRTPSTPSVYSKLGSTPGTYKRRHRSTPREPREPPGHHYSASGFFPGWGVGPMAGQQLWQQPPWYPSYWMPPPWQFPGPMSAQDPARTMQHPQPPAWLVVHFSFLYTSVLKVLVVGSALGTRALVN